MSVQRTQRGKEPGYRRLASSLRSDIRGQRWAEGQTLPTDGELGQEFGVSRQTVRRAYLELVNEGLVYRMPGKGTFITPHHLRYHRPFETVDDLLALSDDTELELAEPLAGTFDADAARELRIEGRLMYGLRFLRRHQGNVFCHTSVFLPPEVGTLLEDEPLFLQTGSTGTTTVIGALAARGIQITGAEQSMTARAATAGDVQHLGCTLGHPLLHVERLYVDPSGQPVEFAVSDFLPEHYTHRLHLGRRPVPVPSQAELYTSMKGTTS